VVKRAVILHGTDGHPSEHWLPWLKKLLESSGYQVFAPELPGNHTPNKAVYEEFLRESGWDFKDNVVIGHSSGATTVLNLLSTKWFPDVSAVVLVAAFLNENLLKHIDRFEPGQFDGLQLGSFDTKLVKSKADKFYFFHGSDDPYCDIKDAQKLCDQLGGKFTIIQNGHHLGVASGFTQIPQLEEVLRQDHIL